MKVVRIRGRSIFLFLLSFLLISWSDHAAERPVNRKERIQIVTEMRDAMLKVYSAIYYKSLVLRDKQGAPFDVTKHLQTCVDREKQVKEDVSPTSVIDLRDRLLECLAPIRDGHLGVKTKEETAVVTLGFGLVERNGRYFITWIEPDLIERREKISQGARDWLLVGMEVIAWEGQPLSKEVERISRYVSQSSERALHTFSTSYLTERDFAYPPKKDVKIKFKQPDGREQEILVPWFAEKKTRTDLDDLFSRLKIARLNDGESLATLKVEGFSVSQPIVEEDGLRNYQDEDGKTALRTGEVEFQGGKRACYMQIPRLAHEEIHLSGQKENLMFVNVAADFLKKCANTRMFILDLRQNLGGSPELTDHLLKLFAKPGKQAPYSASSARISENMDRMLESFEKMESEEKNPKIKEANDQDFSLFKQKYLEAKSKKNLHAPFVTDHYFSLKEETDLDWPGFSAPMITMISERCMSACEYLARGLQLMGRSTLVGNPTSGATLAILPTEQGHSEKGEMNLDDSMFAFKDSFQIFSIRIPFGLDGYTMNGEKVRDFDKNVLEIVRENQPVEPDLKFQSTAIDERESWARLLLTFWK